MFEKMYTFDDDSSLNRYIKMLINVDVVLPFDSHAACSMCFLFV